MLVDAGRRISLVQRMNNSERRSDSWKSRHGKYVIDVNGECSVSHVRGYEDDYVWDNTKTVHLHGKSQEGLPPSNAFAPAHWGCPPPVGGVESRSIAPLGIRTDRLVVDNEVT